MSANPPDLGNQHQALAGTSASRPGRGVCGGLRPTSPAGGRLWVGRRGQSCALGEAEQTPGLCPVDVSGTLRTHARDTHPGHTWDTHPGHTPRTRTQDTCLGCTLTHTQDICPGCTLTHAQDLCPGRTLTHAEDTRLGHTPGIHARDTRSGHMPRTHAYTRPGHTQDTPGTHARDTHSGHMPRTHACTCSGHTFLPVSRLLPRAPPLPTLETTGLGLSL